MAASISVAVDTLEPRIMFWRDQETKGAWYQRIRGLGVQKKEPRMQVKYLKHRTSGVSYGLKRSRQVMSLEEALTS